MDGATQKQIPFNLGLCRMFAKFWEILWFVHQFWHGRNLVITKNAILTLNRPYTSMKPCVCIFTNSVWPWPLHSDEYRMTASYHIGNIQFVYTSYTLLGLTFQFSKICLICLFLFLLLKLGCVNITVCNLII